VFVDFEWTIAHLYLVGVWVWDTETRKGTYRAFWANQLDAKSEHDLLEEVYQYLTPYREVLYYYFAEQTAWPRFCNKYGFSKEKVSLFENAKDMYKIFWEGPVLIRGCYTCKLKHIAKAMKENGLIQIEFPSDEGSVEDGKHSMALAESLYSMNHSINHSRICSEETKEKRDALQQSLQKYNQFDCQSLCEIWCWLDSIRKE
jgi:hypothetical protein